jgi:colanic acid/amylovoran biosynthesis glycosyltransferase
VKIAYLVSEYPSVTHTFIRRELLGVESLGIEVERFSIRKPAQARLVEAADQAEALRTSFVLNDKRRLILAFGRTALRSPMAWLRTAVHAIRLGRRSYAGLLRHLAYFLEACAITESAREKGIEHVHVHFASNAAMVALLAKRLKGPTFSMMIHGPADFDAAELTHLSEKVAAAEFVTTISSFAKSQIFRWSDPESWPKVHVVRCGVDGEFLDDPPTLVPDVNRLVNIGRLARAKAQPLLIEAVARLVKEGLNPEVIIVGDGELRGTLERMIVQHGVEKFVRLEGWRDGATVKRLLRESRGLVLPSFGEGVPVSIMESFALGRPVIATRIAGIPELVVDRETGWLIPAGDLEALVNSMREMLRTPVDQLSQMGLRGRNLVAQNHNALHEATKLAELLRRSKSRPTSETQSFAGRGPTR